MIKRKGIDLLADAFSAVAHECSNLRLVVCGDGPLNVSVRKKLHHLQDKVSFLGFRDWEQLPSVYRDADFLCAPSRYDGWGLIVPEALASGLPVLSSTAMGASKDLVSDGDNGWIVEASQLEPLKSWLRMVSSMKNHDLKRLSENAVLSITPHQLANGVERFVEAIQNAHASSRH